MEDIKLILEKQNIFLLEKIANDKFSETSEKKEFIEKYNKINYRNYKIIYNNNNIIDIYRKTINNIAL